MRRTPIRVRVRPFEAGGGLPAETPGDVSRQAGEDGAAGSRSEAGTPRRLSASLVFALALASALSAVWCVPRFVTQDGAAHVYNARLLLELRDPAAPVNQFYSAHWTPLPNLAGHIALMGLLSLLTPRVADLLMISLTLSAFACAVWWLRLRVAGWGGAGWAGALCVLLALNWMWLMGFYSFSLGAAMFALTLGAWWHLRERFDWRAALAVTLLLLAGYFCHAVSFGLTAVGLGVLALATPDARWGVRCLWTAASFVPLAPLVMIYRGLMRSGGGEAHMVWRNMTSFWSPRAWLMRWQAAETLQLGGRKFLPFSSTESAWHALFSPTFLAALSLTVLLAASLFAARREEGGLLCNGWMRARRGWLLLALLLFAGWAFAPDDLGEQHGMFLRPRVLLLALVAVVPVLRFDLRTRASYVGVVLLTAALLFQLAWTWDYALAASRAAGEFSRASEFVGRDRRVATLLLPAQGSGDGDARAPSRGDYLARFTVRPVAHLDALYGVGTGNVVWNNYEAAYYIFPVKFRTEAAALRALELDRLNGALRPASPQTAEGLASRRAGLLARDHEEIDELLVWGADARLDADIARWFDPQPVFDSGRLRLFRRR